MTSKLHLQATFPPLVSLLKAFLLKASLLIFSIGVSASEFSNPTFDTGFSATPAKNQNQNPHEVEILPVDDAFVLQVLHSKGKVEVLWQIRPGHYLYKHRLGVDGSGKLGEPLIPSGLAKHDEYFGDVEVYYEALIVEVPVLLSTEKQASSLAGEKITVSYQGCSDAGICYPPQKRQFTL